MYIPAGWLVVERTINDTGVLGMRWLCHLGEPGPADCLQTATESLRVMTKALINPAGKDLQKIPQPFHVLAKVGWAMDALIAERAAELDTQPAGPGANLVQPAAAAAPDAAANLQAARDNAAEQPAPDADKDL